MRVYYAHCIAIYNTLQENRDVELLEGLGHNVVNPNSRTISQRCDRIKEVHRAFNLAPSEVDRVQATLAEIEELRPFTESGQAVMHLVFKPLVTNAEALAFRGLPDGRIPAGVGLEVEWAEEAGLPIIELPTFAYQRVMSVNSTRQYLREIGVR